MQRRRQLPAEVGGVFQPVVEPEAAVWRMTVRRIAGDEYPSHLVALRHGDAQIPEADMVEPTLEAETGGLVHQSAKIETVSRLAARRRRMEEESLADIDATEELPIPVERRVHDAIGRALGKALQSFVKLARAENDKHHHLVEIGSAALDPDLASHERVAAVAADEIVRFQHGACGPTFLDQGDANP